MKKSASGGAGKKKKRKDSSGFEKRRVGEAKKPVKLEITE